MVATPTRRPYTLRRRAARQAETRARIVEAALAQFAAVGPARATISGIATAAAVERLTVYRHFPDGVGIVTAAVERLLDEHPLPPMTAWFTERNPRARLRRALAELFDFYRASGPVTGRLLADRDEAAEVGPAFQPLLTPLADLPAALAEGWPTYGERGRERLRAVIAHALRHETWRSLAIEAGLDDDEAADLLARLAAATARPDD
jgi:AcrR family transcriptional regulator